MYARSALCAGAVLRTDGPPTLKKFLGGFPNTAACLVWKRNSPIGIFGDGDFRGRGFSGTGIFGNGRIGNGRIGNGRIGNGRIGNGRISVGD